MGGEDIMDGRALGNLEVAVGALDHFGLIVSDLDSALAHYRDVFSAVVSPKEVHARYGCSSAFVDLGYSRMRLFQPHGPSSPITSFFGAHELVGIHHICYRVAAIEFACGALKAKGYRPLGGEDYKRTANGKRMIFFRPPHQPGPLVKLEEQ